MTIFVILMGYYDPDTNFAEAYKKSFLNREDAMQYINDPDHTYEVKRVETEEPSLFECFEFIGFDIQNPENWDGFIYGILEESV